MSQRHACGGACYLAFCSIAGDRALEKAGLKLLKQMLLKVATPAAGQAQASLSFKLDLVASDKISTVFYPCLLCSVALMRLDRSAAASFSSLWYSQCRIAASAPGL